MAEHEKQRYAGKLLLESIEEIERLRETLGKLQHYTSCTSYQVYIIKEALK